DPVRVYRVLPDPAAFNRSKARRETIFIFLMGLGLLLIASVALWYVLSQPYGKPRDQASAPATREALPEARPSPPAAQAAKEAASKPQPAPSAAPATLPAAA